MRKYVEIEWKKITFLSLKHQENAELYLNICSNYPTPYIARNTTEKLISLEQQLLSDKTWKLTPKSQTQKMLFGGYVENMLQLTATILVNNNCTIQKTLKSWDTEKLTENSLKLFPFLGISNLIFSGIYDFLEREDVLGSFLLQLRRNCTFPICYPLTKKIQYKEEEIGEIDLQIYIKPEQPESVLFYRDVVIFPFSEKEIVVYYSGDLADTRQLYMIWTFDHWKTNPFVKMKRLGRNWTSILEIPENVEKNAQLELSFTDMEERWDSKDGDNWVFEKFRWL